MKTKKPITGKSLTAKDYDELIGYGKELNTEAIVARMKRPVQYVDKDEAEKAWKAKQRKINALKAETEKTKEVSEEPKKLTKKSKKVSKTEKVKVEEVKPTTKEPETFEELLSLYGGASILGNTFVGNTNFGVRRSLLSKKFDTSKLKEKPLELALVKYFKEKFKTKFTEPNEVVKFTNSVKGVCYKIDSTVEIGKNKVDVHSILKLSKWIAVDSRVRNCFTNHRFIYLNVEKSPVLIINVKTQKIDGYIMPNSTYWNNAGTEPQNK